MENITFTISSKRRKEDGINRRIDILTKLTSTKLTGARYTSAMLRAMAALYSEMNACEPSPARVKLPEIVMLTLSGSSDG